MGDGFKKITKRVKRFFGKKDPEDPPKKLSASQIIKPEEVIPQHGKRAPKSTTRRTRRYEHLEQTTDCGATITELPWGVVHICFHQVPEEPLPDDTVKVRDPVTRRLSRKKLKDGMKRTTGFYDESGVLYDETNTDW